MSSPSNLYAEKIYAEQPTALWSLDDDCSFISYFSDGNLDLSTWSGATITDIPNDATDPFAQILNSSFVTLTVPAGETVTITAPTNVTTKDHFSAGLWINPQSAITSIKFNTATLTSTEIDLAGVVDQWKYVGQFFEVSSSGITSKAFSIDIENSTPNDAEVYLNGFSIGYNQNYFGSYTTGKQLHQITQEESPALAGTYALEAYQYGIGEYSGWYIGNTGTSDKKKKVYARNSSLPLVYGSSTSTIIYENPTGPSLVVPGMGFLNESGSKQSITFEAWMRIKTDGNRQQNPFRIMGPLGSSDGLYVNGQHLILKVGTSFASHYVGEWMRPMLINIDYTPELVRLLVNGEVVCSIKISSPTLATIDNPYIGFYAGANVSFIELDCIAVYPYRVNPIMAKRRYGYAQAVSLPSEIETAYSGKQLVMDYTFANYSSDYSYPKIENWSSSVSETAYMNNTILGSPAYQKPDVVFTDKNIQDSWETDVINYNKSQSSSAPVIRLLLPQYSGVSGYLYFRTLRQENMKDVGSFFIVCDHPTVSADTDEIIFRLQDPQTLDSIVAIRSGSQVTYYYNVAGKRGIITSMLIYPGQKFVVGLTKTKSTQDYIKEPAVRNFINRMQSFKLFVGGDYSGSDNQLATTFSGNIHKVAILAPLNYWSNKMFMLHNNYLVPDPYKFESFYSATASYEYKVTANKFNNDYIYRLATSSVSYWTDYLPLPKLAKKIKDASGKDIYVTDMIQFNIDAPPPTTITSNVIDSSSADVRSYVYFSRETPNSMYFGKELQTVKLPESKYIDLSSSWTDWVSRKFEVVDDTVILPPRDGLQYLQNQTNMYMSTTIEMYSQDTELLPIRIKSLQYAAQTFQRKTTTGFDKRYAKKISTRTGVETYMFSESSGTYNYNAKNPLVISKQETPYLYATNKSGVKVLNAYSTENDRGIYIPINENGISAYYISTLTFYALYNDSNFQTATSFIEMYDNDRKYRVVCKKLGNDSKKAYLSVQYQQTQGGDWVDYVGPEFYINGVLSSNPTINVGEWTGIGISFAMQPLNMSSRTDFKIEIVGSLAINNLAYFQLRPEELAQQILPKEWNDYDTEKNWSDLDTFETVGIPWSTVAADKGKIKPALTPAIISSIYYGTNKIIAVEDGDLSGIGFQNFEYDIIGDVIWQKTITTAP